MSKRFLHPDDIFHDVNYEKNKWYMKNFFNVERFKPRRKGSRNLITIAVSSPSLRATYLSGHEWRVSVNSFELISSSVWKIERTYVKSVWIENNFEPTIMLTIYCHSPKRISTHYRPLVLDISSGHLRIPRSLRLSNSSQDNHGIFLATLNAFSRDSLRCALWFLLSICLHIIALLYLPLSFIFLYSWPLFYFLSFTRRLYPLPLCSALFLSDFLFIPTVHLSIYLSVCLFRPCVVCVCIRATSGIE